MMSISLVKNRCLRVDILDQEIKNLSDISFRISDNISITILIYFQLHN